MTCTIDDADAHLFTKERQPDANILVGLIIPDSEKQSIIKVIQAIKGKYNLKGRPIKYKNGDTVERFFLDNIKRPDLYENLKTNQYTIRKEIIKEISGFPFQVVISWDICSGETNFTNQRNRNLGSSFLDILNTAAQCLPKHKNESFEIVLDRFPKGRGGLESILESTFATWKETELTRSLKETCTLFNYGVTLQNELLQLTDIIAGTFRDLIQDSIKNKSPRSSDHLHLLPKLVGYPNRIEDKGIFGPPQFWHIINKAITSELHRDLIQPQPLPPLFE
ncbi:hypothetical protein [Nafulsella turpanensis]|uniref:hypothetical protein n=1 Tax=Nafulsella turpanensis TaxID=1265690 RepID=UPI0003455746|nr:hypothetical protein [Nafulsella turpanensis]